MLGAHVTAAKSKRTCPMFKQSQVAAFVQHKELIVFIMDYIVLSRSPPFHDMPQRRQSGALL